MPDQYFLNKATPKDCMHKLSTCSLLKEHFHKCHSLGDMEGYRLESNSASGLAVAE